jgi:HSF-type DNA-binding
MRDRLALEAEAGRAPNLRQGMLDRPLPLAHPLAGSSLDLLRGLGQRSPGRIIDEPMSTGRQSVLESVRAEIESRLNPVPAASLPVGSTNLQTQMSLMLAREQADRAMYNQYTAAQLRQDLLRSANLDYSTPQYDQSLLMRLAGRDRGMNDISALASRFGAGDLGLARNVASLPFQGVAQRMPVAAPGGMMHVADGAVASYIGSFGSPNQMDLKRKADEMFSDPLSQLDSNNKKKCLTAIVSETSGRRTFPSLLYNLLMDMEAQGKTDIISFTPDGKAFCIHKPDEFLKEVSPTYFAYSKIASFKRQLQLYRFRRMSRNVGFGHGRPYMHPFFIRGRPELLCQVQRSDNESTK